MGTLAGGVVVSLRFNHAVTPATQSKITAMLHVVIIVMTFPSITNEGFSVSKCSKYRSAGEV